MRMHQKQMQLYYTQVAGKCAFIAVINLIFSHCHAKQRKTAWSNKEDPVKKYGTKVKEVCHVI